MPSIRPLPSAARHFAAPVLLAALACLAAPLAAGAHGQVSPLDADHVRVQTDAPPDGVAFSFLSTDAEDFFPAHDPAAETAAMLVRGTGPNAGRTPLISFDPNHWTTTANGYAYDDPSGTRGGVTHALIEPGRLELEAAASGWGFSPAGPQDEVWVHFRVEDEWFCARFSAASATVQSNVAGHFEAIDAVAPGSCPTQVCGNGVQEIGEECDDGNLETGDGCDPDCAIGACTNETFESTFAGIQSRIFESEAYGCSRGTCHDSYLPDGNLDLSHENAYLSLLGESGLGATADEGNLLRVLPTEPNESLLYLKLLTKNRGQEYSGPDVGTGMPTGLTALSDDHLEAVRLWIRGGAPREGVVEGTQDLLGTCFPPPNALKTPVPDAPPAEIGFQLRQTPYPLLGVNPPVSQGETELCMTTYYDLSSRVPEDARIPCPPEFQVVLGCAQDSRRACTTDAQCVDAVEGQEPDDKGPCIAVKNALNPENECFAYDRLTVIQDPQSHHSILGNYTGRALMSDPSWGEWTYKFEPTELNAQNGQPCDPTQVDPALGYNPGCSSVPTESIACVGYGPSDLGNLSLLTGMGGNYPQFSLSQETYFDYRFPSGVHDVMPLKGAVIWNSHAFNLTPDDSTMAQFLNVEYAPEPERVHRSEPLFDARWIFAYFVEPFEREEVCATWTAPRGTRLFQLSSHTHRHGVRWRTWGPPNDPCRPECPTAEDSFALGLLSRFGICNASSPLPICEGPRDGDPPLYFSSDYSDPLNMDIAPPMELDSPNDADRTFLYCAVMDNGATPSSPPVKRASTSPQPPDTFGAGGFLEAFGGPCRENLSCANEGPNQGMRCANAQWYPQHELCDSSPGAGDGDCDACPVHGGVTTEDEMFILLGNYYLTPEPGASALGAIALAATATLARRRLRRRQGGASHVR